MTTITANTSYELGSLSRPMPPVYSGFTLSVDGFAVSDEAYGVAANAALLANNSTLVSLAGVGAGLESTVLSLAAINFHGDNSKGFQSGLVGVAGEIDRDEGNTPSFTGVQANIYSFGRKMRGLQFGVVCHASQSSCLQVGLLTIRGGEGPWWKKYSPLVGFSNTYDQ